MYSLSNNQNLPPPPKPQPENDDPAKNLNTIQSLVIKGIYLGDMILLAINFFFCFYIVIRYVCRTKEIQVGYIYYFYTYAIIISALRLVFCILIFAKPGWGDLTKYEYID